MPQSEFCYRPADQTRLRRSRRLKGNYRVQRTSQLISLALGPQTEVARPATPERCENDSGSAICLPAHEPQYDKHNQNDAEDAAETGAPVPAVSIVSPADTEDEDQDYDKENCAHVSGLLRVR